MSSATRRGATTTSAEQAMSDNKTLDNDFKTAADRYLIPFIFAAVVAAVVWVCGVFISRRAYRGKMTVKDLELAIALKEAANPQQASAGNVSSGKKTEPNGKATTSEDHAEQSGGISISNHADLADGNYAAVQPKAPFWGSVSNVDSPRLSTHHPSATDHVPHEIIVSAASETNSEDMVDEKKKTAFGSFDDGETELTQSASIIYSQPFRKSRSIVPSPETRETSSDSSDEESPGLPKRNY